VGITQELLYLLLLYAVLGENLSLNTALIIAFAIMILGPCISRLCCRGAVGAPQPFGFAALNNLV